MLLTIYATCVAQALLTWFYRSVSERYLKGGMTSQFTWKHYVVGFLLCFIPVVNIFTGFSNMYWMSLNPAASFYRKR